MENTNINYGTALALSSILGKCTIKALGTELFFPIVKLKSNLTAAVKQYQELQQELTSACGVEYNSDGSFKFLKNDEDPVEVMNKLNKGGKDLIEDTTDIQSVKMITEKQLEELFQENPKLTTGELEILMELVK